MAQMVKCPSAMQETQVRSWVGKIPWRRERLPTPVFWPGEFHGQRSLVGCSPWSRKESDTTEQLHFHFFHFRKNKSSIKEQTLSTEMIYKLTF